MSRIEKFISNNRDQFDDQAPSEELWQKIEAAMTKKKGKTFQLRAVVKWTAAAAVLLMVAGAAFILFNKKNTTDPEIAKNQGRVVAEPEMAEAPQMNQFAKLIAVKQEELKILSKEQPQLYNKFAKDITQLDSSYNTLKNKLSVTPNRELLIEAMIQNLELQLNVLNQQLNIIHQIKQSKKSHEKNKSFT